NLAAADPAQADLFGALVNLQSNVDGAAVSALVDGLQIGLGLNTAETSTFSITGNSAVAAADGSYATNQLLVTGTTHAASHTNAAAGEYSYILQNTQAASANGSVDAIVQGVTVGMTGDEDTGSTLAISGNHQIAQARSNVALNSLSL